MIIGSHVKFAGDGLLGSTKEAISYKANTFMFYTGAPQNSIRKPIDKSKTMEAQILMKENNIDINNVICHAPYIINLANTLKPEAYEFSKLFLKNEIKRCEELGVKYIVVHPGSSLSLDKSVALKNISDAINEIIDNDTSVMILLETMAGKGTECGINIGELKEILSGIIYVNKVGICLDTCHLNDSGINLNDFDNYLSEFDEKIGINKIKCIHINDSLNIVGSHKDRHANIGYGTIGFNIIMNIISNEKLKDVPKILETPYINQYPPYLFEIDMIRKNEFNEHLENDVIDFYKNR